MIRRFLYLAPFLAGFAASINAEDTASTIGHWRFEAEPGFTHDSGARNLSLGTAGSDPSPYPLPGAGAGSAFPRDLLDPPLANDRAAALNGHGNFIQADALALSSTGRFTIEAFARQTAGTSASAYIAAHWQFSGGNNRSWGLAVAGSIPPSGLVPGELFLVLSPDGSALHIIGSNLIFPRDTDSYVAAVFQSGSVHFYYRNLEAENGLVVASTSHSLVNVFPSEGPFTIGAYDTNRNRWTGLIDEVRYSSGARTTDQLLVEGTPAAPPPAFVTAPGSYLGFARIEVRAHAENHTIRYTLDGSLPAEKASVYAEPILVEETVTFRARPSPRGLLRVRRSRENLSFAPSRCSVISGRVLPGRSAPQCGRLARKRSTGISRFMPITGITWATLALNRIDCRPAGPAPSKAPASTTGLGSTSRSLMPPPAGFAPGSMFPTEIRYTPAAAKRC